MSDVLQPRQFGPNGKYTTTPVDMWGRSVEGMGPGAAKEIAARHTRSGRLIGQLAWQMNDEGEGRAPIIADVNVSGNMRRKGVASAMLSHARDIEPRLRHSRKLSEDGSAWAKARP